ARRRYIRAPGELDVLDHAVRQDNPILMLEGPLVADGAVEKVHERRPIVGVHAFPVAQVRARTGGRIKAEDARVFGRPAHLAGAHVPAPAAGMANLLPFSERRLARPERCFSPLALDELADLAADGRHHGEQVRVGLTYLAAEELHDPQDVAAEQDGKSEGRV